MNQAFKNAVAAILEAERTMGFLVELEYATLVACFNKGITVEETADAIIYKMATY